MFMVGFLSGGHGVLDELQLAVAGHAVRKVLSEGETETGVNGVEGFGFFVADIDVPNGDFVAVGVLVGLRAVKEHAAPKSGIGGGVVQFKCVVAHRS